MSGGRRACFSGGIMAKKGALWILKPLSISFPAAKPLKNPQRHPKNQTGLDTVKITVKVMDIFGNDTM